MGLKDKDWFENWCKKKGYNKETNSYSLNIGTLSNIDPVMLRKLDK